MATTLNLNNFTQQNTPPFWHKIGNFCLLLAAVGGAAAIAPISAPLIVTIGQWTAVAGAVGKILTKFTGQETDVPPLDKKAF